MPEIDFTAPTPARRGPGTLIWVPDTHDAFIYPRDMARATIIEMLDEGEDG